MHIAICDDNIADRKQLERLLQREADRRASSGGILYIDSYGHPDRLLQNPLQYDAFFIDICHTEGYLCADIISSLASAGSTVPVILCCSEINYRNDKYPDSVFFMDKPVKNTVLSDILDEVQKRKDSSVPLIELRGDRGTCYVAETDILYAQENKSRHTTVTLTDGRQILIDSTAENFFEEIEHYPVFLLPLKYTLINCRYIKSIRFCTITMCDNASVNAFGPALAYAKDIFRQIHS